jgi:ribosome biogenesis protein Nip4
MTDPSGVPAVGETDAMSAQADPGAGHRGDGPGDAAAAPPEAPSLLRRPDEMEHETIHKSLNAVEKGLAERFLAGRELAVYAENGVRRIGLTTARVLELPESLRRGAACGLPVGEFGPDEDFRLDLQGAMEWARITQAQSVRAAEKASRLFLYGRNLLAGSILRHDPKLRPGDTCVVTNPRGEGLGLGVVVGKFKGTGEAVHPVHDLGRYLREQDLDE